MGLMIRIIIESNEKYIYCVYVIAYIDLLLVYTIG